FRRGAIVRNAAVAEPVKDPPQLGGAVGEARAAARRTFEHDRRPMRRQDFYRTPQSAELAALDVDLDDVDVMTGEHAVERPQRDSDFSRALGLGQGAVSG